MKFFLDTANLKEIEEAASYGVLDGVTTNPSLMAKEGIKGHKAILEHYKTICNLVAGGDISAEVLALDFDGMMREAHELAALNRQIVVKVPCTIDGIKTINALSREKIRTNCTLVFSIGQALLAAKAGATYVSPFVGRLDDISEDGIALVRSIVNCYSQYCYETEVLAASIRHPQHVVRCIEVNADVVTCPLAVIRSLFKHPLTEAGLAKFVEDSKKMDA
ncbi:MAG: fructose-6-phosphate aldolase [Bacteroides sp.]